MAGARFLRTELTVLKCLSEGPATKVELKRALLWDPIGPSRVLDSVLATMRIAGLIEPGARGEWRLAEGCVLCPTCHGRGLVSEESD